MQRWLWIVIALCVSTSVYFVVRYGLRPKAIPVMSATEFQSIEQIGVVVYRRLRQSLRSERLVVLGSSEDEFGAGIARAAKADGENILVFKAEQLRDENFMNNVAQSVKSGQLVLVEASTPEVSHLVKGSLSSQLEKLVGHPILSISLLPLGIAKNEYDDLQTQCLDATESESAEKRLNCAAQRVARKNLKKKLAPEKIWAVMERHGLKEYLVFVHKP